jgi:hypothetical protein
MNWPWTPGLAALEGLARAPLDGTTASDAKEMITPARNFSTPVSPQAETGEKSRNNQALTLLRALARFPLEAELALLNPDLKQPVRGKIVPSFAGYTRRLGTRKRPEFAVNNRCPVAWFLPAPATGIFLFADRR